MKKLLYLLFLLPLFLTAQYKQLSPKAEISVITCGSGSELYSTFGHSAFRIQDIPNRLDRVYNYGTFNFNTPNFYLKFTRGKLLYELRAYNFGNFLREYHREQRWVDGQVLDLKQIEKQQIFEFLENNAKPENRAYKYDFFYDNCSTKMYDVLDSVLGQKLIFDEKYESKIFTHRNLIHQYTKDLPWSEFGIDLALGSVIDRKASTKEYMFLPNYVFKALVKVNIKDHDIEKPLIKRVENILLDFNSPSTKNIFTPLLIFSIMALIVIWISYKDYKNKTRNKAVDFIMFFVTGLTGIVLLLLWFATDHTATADNFNILWAFAPNILFAFLISKHNKLSYYYIFTLLALLDLLLILWIFKVQIFAIALIPILIMLYVRYLYLWFFFKNKQ
ncbi:MAG: DUF4105 domain-containing protein [Bacteroidota bacterium]